MYRGDEARALQELEGALERRRDLLRRVVERTESIATKNDALADREGITLDVPPVDVDVGIPEVVEIVPPAQRAELTARVTRDCARLEGELTRLDVAERALEDRLAGQPMGQRAFGMSAGVRPDLSGGEQLTAPPRRVPLRYVIAEWATWFGGFAYAWAAAVVFTRDVRYAAPLVLLLVATIVRRRSFGYRVLSALAVAVAIVPVAVLVARAFQGVAWMTHHPGAVLLLLVGAVFAVDAGRAVQRAMFLARCKRADDGELYDPRTPLRGLRTSVFGSAPRPDAEWHWDPRLQGAVIARVVMVCTALGLWAVVAAIRFLKAV